MTDSRFLVTFCCIVSSSKIDFFKASSASAERSATNEQILLQSSNETRGHLLGKTNIHGYIRFSKDLWFEKVFAFVIASFTATIKNDCFCLNFFRRQCYFESERHLTYYKTYTQRNCELECFANFTIKKCNCSPFFMPS